MKGKKGKENKTELVPFAVGQAELRRNLDRGRAGAVRHRDDAVELPPFPAHGRGEPFKVFFRFFFFSSESFFPLLFIAIIISLPPPLFHKK